MFVRFQGETYSYKNALVLHNYKLEDVPGGPIKVLVSMLFYIHLFSTVTLWHLDLTETVVFGVSPFSFMPLQLR